MSTVSPRASALKPSATLAMGAKAKKLAAEGNDVVNFTLGEPDFKTPKNICEAAKKAIDDGWHGYTPSKGRPDLLKAIAGHYKKFIGIDYDPTTEIVASPGAKFSVYLAFQVLLGEGDEALMPAPYWVSYPEMIQLSGATPVVVETKESDGFALTAATLEKAITPKTKVLLLNSPSNPSGAVIPPAEIRNIAQVLEKRNIWCISDEIYDRLAYDGMEVLSIASCSEWMRNHSIIINGCSKAYAMTGWRLGWAAGPKEVMKAADAWQSQETSNVCAIVQAAGIEALNGQQDSVDVMKAEFDKRRRLVVQLLNDIPGVTCIMPKGAFYAYPNISGLFGKTMEGVTINSPMAFCEVALNKKYVALVAGEDFGSPHHVRISYACSEERIREGCKRLKDMVLGK